MKNICEITKQTDAFKGINKAKNELKPFGYYIEILSRKYGDAKTFDDWLQIIVCSLSMGRKEELYFKTIKPYSRDELDLFTKAFSSLIIQMTKNELVDPFGDYFQENVSHGQNGQFFTPPPICNMIASITGVSSNGASVLDPACGSGRLLLASAQQNRNQYFVGQDVSYTCCMMTLINMCLFSLSGQVAHMDTLRMEIYTRWAVVVDSVTRIPTIVELDPEELQRPMTKEDYIPQPVKGLVQPIKNMKPINFVRFTPKN